jgi:phosphoribosylformylglycinamidine synthase
VYPTPVIGMVGVIESVERVTRSMFRTAGDSIVLLGEPTAELGASEYLARIHGVVGGAPPACDLVAERALIDAVVEAISAGAVASAHDCSDGGLAVALAECCIMDREVQMGATIDLSRWGDLPLRALLFGEAQARIVVSTPTPDTVLSIAARHGVPAVQIGRVDSADAPLQITVGRTRIVAQLGRLDAAYHEAIPSIMERAVASVG